MQQAVEALEARKLNRTAYADKHGIKSRPGVGDLIAADAELLAREGRITRGGARRLAAWAKKEAATPAGADKVKTILERLGAVYFHRTMLSLVERALKQKGIDLRVAS